MNLGEIKSNFSTILNRRDCTTGQRDTFVDQGIAYVQRVLRIPGLRKAIQVEIDANNYNADDNGGGLPIPSDFIKLDTIRIQTSTGQYYTLVRKALDEVLSYVPTTDLPRIFAQQGAEWIFGPTPQAGTIVRVDYYSELSGLDEDTDENMATIIAPYLVIYAALVYAGRSFTDKRREEWKASRQEILDELHGQAADDELSGGAAVSPAYAWPED